MANKYQYPVELKLNDFNLSTIKPDSVIVALGMRRSGKSYLIKDILYNLRHIPIGKVYSRTEPVNKCYSKFIPEMLISSEFNSGEVESIFKRQEVAINENWRNPYFFLLMDDVLADKKDWSKDKTISNIFCNGRHYNILYILASQYCMGIGPDLRTNIDYTFIFYTNNISERKKIYENYAGVFKDKYEFYSAMDALEPYECLVINNDVSIRDRNKQIFVYTAQPHPNFLMCNNKLWQIQEEQKIKREQKRLNQRTSNHSYNRKSYNITKMGKRT